MGQVEVRWSQLRPGMVPVQDVSAPASQQVVARAGQPLSPQTIALLGRLGVRSVVIGTAFADPAPAARPGAPLPDGQPGAITSKLVQAGSSALGAGVEAGKALAPHLKSLGEGLGSGLAAIKADMAHKAKIKAYPAIELESTVKVVVDRNVSTVKQLDETFLKSAKVEFSAVETCVERTINEIIENKEVLENLNDLRSYDEYTAGHSANVMSLCLVVGLTLGYDARKLRTLGIGALLHDLGKHEIPDGVLNKPDKLTEEEFKVMQSHPERTEQILRNYSWATEDIIGIGLYHHEKYNGLGYPRKIKGEHIPQMAMIAAVVDVYDALISKRVYKKPMPPDLVYKIITDGVGTHFDPKVVWAFQKFIVPYPANAEVVLNSGQRAKVLKVNRDFPKLPVIEVEDKVIDLAKDGKLQVVNLYHPPDPEKPATAALARAGAEALRAKMLNRAPAAPGRPPV